MKSRYLTPLLLVALLLAALPARAHDFEVGGIYYNILDADAKTVAVTYKGSSYNNYSNEYSGAVSIPETVTYSNTPYSVTSIQNNAFYYCQKLTNVTIGNSVTSIGSRAFYGCSGLTTVNYNATNCSVSGPMSPFLGCTNLTEVIVGENVNKIPAYLFCYCSGLTSLEIPSSVKSIGDYAFNGCSGLTSLEIPSSVNHFGLEVFEGCYKLVTYEIISTTQTTATVSLTTPTKYTPAMRNAQGRGKGIVTGLKPGIGYCDLYLIINGKSCDIVDLVRVPTKSFDVDISGSAGTTILNAIGSHNADDVIIAQQGIDIGSTTEYNGNNSIEVTGLEPNTSYDIYYKVYLDGGWSYSANKTFTTAALTWESGEYQATSTSSVRLLTETNCDATEGTGIEWRRYGAPENMKPNSVACPVVDGMLVGTLRGLNTDVYYEYRPYYTSAAGNTYYGEWTAFFSGDAYVHFDPEVRTYADMQVYKNNATIKGYALEGSDAISAQGFEYWKSSNQPVPASTAEVKTIAASGIAMTATIADLEYNTTYCYRAFVTTATGTYYGDTMEFTTEVISGIETIDVDATELTVSLRENPATATAWVRAAGAAVADCQYYIVSMNGATVDNGIIPADGDWQPIELNCPSGVYILMVTDGSARRTLRLIVR